MKTPLLILLLLAGLQSHAAPSVCEALFKDKLSQTDKLALDWATNDGFRGLLMETTRMGQVKSVYNQKLETRLYFTATGLPGKDGKIPLIDPEAKAVIVYFHGSGTAAGSGANFTHSMNKFAALGIAGLSFDLPFHAEGPRRDQFNSIDYFMNWIREVLKPALASGKPVYLVGHSFGPAVIGEIAKRDPQAFAGLGLLSPVGFNDTLINWENSNTNRMKFPGEPVAENTLAGVWAEKINTQFTWNKSGGASDPTVANPNLRVEILSGDREEYVPAPTGGRRGLPRGKNTYDLAAAIRPFYKNAHIVIEPGIGHAIFNHRDANGQEVVTRTIFSLLGLSQRDESKIAAAQTEIRNARPAWLQLEGLFAADTSFQAYLTATNQTGRAKALIRTWNNEQALKLMTAYRDAYKARVKDIGA